MDSTPDVLAAEVRARRAAIDSDLERLRVRAREVVRAADPRPVARRWSEAGIPVALGAAALWLWRRRRRSVGSLQGLLEHEVVELHNMEEHPTSAAAANTDLRALLHRHAEQTATQAERLDRVLRSIGGSPRRRKSDAVAAFEQEVRALVRSRMSADVRDAWIIATVQRIEHLEIASYGSARAFAATLGYTYAAQLLQQSLDEEKAMDEQLTALAEHFVNPESIR
jgi:ferritin-like metal-binding protein YciE